MNINLTEKEKRILYQINELIQNIKINYTRVENEHDVNFTKFFIPSENKQISESEYFYNDNLSFLHFTSLFALQSIITNQNIRLYNLHNLNDPREFSFAGDIITFNKVYKQDAKDNFYLLSMCNTELLKNDIGIEFNMWRLYGDNGKGTVIEFDFNENKQINWNDYFLSKVFYGSSSKTRLNAISDLLKSTKKESPIIEIDLGQIICFHKSKLYKLEKEIRLLYDGRIGRSEYHNKKGRKTSPIIITDIVKSTTNNEKVKFLELPIFTKNFQPVFKKNSIPIPKIKRIILGYQYKSNYSKIKKDLVEICNEYLGYVPNIEKSRLTNTFHGKL